MVGECPGGCTVRIRGRGVVAIFTPEAGGHRWQRVPPTEKRGRRQTSSITVAVLPESLAVAEKSGLGSLRSDTRIDNYVGSGPGGQHKNKVATAIRLTHGPTGIVVCCESERSKHQNEREAFAVLQARVDGYNRERAEAEENGHRREQIGTGYRGDKIRTVQMQNDTVTNHITGQKCSAKVYLKGNLEAIRADIEGDATEARP